jgi:phytoene synthase
VTAAALSPEAAYAEVQRLTRERARNFAYGIMLLPRPKRLALSAIYAFAREVDDVADGDAPAREKRRQLEALHAGLDGPPPVASAAEAPGAAGGAVSHDAMWVALADARGRFPISAKALHDLVDGALMDLDRQRYDDFEQLVEYCRRVAGAVGIACMAVYGADQPQRAEALGIALQLINIIRDVPEDWRLGRVYLPQDELASYGVAEADIAASRMTTAWQALMAHQAARARNYLGGGLTLLDHLDRRSAACVRTFANLYAATLERIERSGFDVFDGPPRLSTGRKAWIATRGLLG